MQSSRILKRIERRFDLSPKAAFLILGAVLLGLVVLFSVGTHEVYEAVTEGDGVAQLDQPVLDLVVANRGPVLTWFATAVTFLADRIMIPVFAIVAIAVFTKLRRSWMPTVVMVTGMLGSLLLTVVGKNIAGRDRPPEELALPPFETSPAFPSGHTQNSTVLVVLIGYLVIRTVERTWLRRTLLGVLAAFPVFVALSRVYLGQHWLTDTMAGGLVGLAWGLAVVVAHKVLRAVVISRSAEVDGRKVDELERSAAE